MAYLTPPSTPSTASFDLNTPAKRQERMTPSEGTLFTPPYTPESSKRSSVINSLKRLSIDGESRPLSDNELSYFLPSRDDGVNDMYLHHRLTAPAHLVEPKRVLHLWAYQLLRHPLLASQIRFNDYENVSFLHHHPLSLMEALSMASERLTSTQLTDKTDIIDTYLNGPRTLSNNHLAMLHFAAPAFTTTGQDATLEFMLCATHYLGDGMALHTFMNEFYTLLGSDKSTFEFAKMIESQVGCLSTLPSSLEDRLPTTGDGSKLANAVGSDECARNDAKLVGGQTFPGAKVKQPRQTVVPTFAYSSEETKTILGSCKKNGVTIAHAVFALCNIAWARQTSDKSMPCLIYSALNLRPNMTPTPTQQSFFHLAVGYFNIVLPSYLPSSLSTSELFWYRARCTKSQTVAAVKSPFVVARSRATSSIRRERAIKWAKIDDEAAAKKNASQGKKNAGLGLGWNIPTREPPATAVSVETSPKIAPIRAAESTPPMPSTSSSILPPVNQKALMGVSMLGNLDGMYKHAAFPDLHLESLTTGSRQRSGGLLLFAYTFGGKLWFSLGYDRNGFEAGAIEGFYEGVKELVKEVLL